MEIKNTISDNRIADVIDNQRPFPGLSSYEEKNKSQFGGRDTEIKELFRLVESNKLTIVFGKSGIGKTSLIKAGLIPELQKNFYFPVYIRIDFSAEKVPLEQLKELIYEDLFTVNKSVSKIGDTTLWQYFHDLQLKDGIITPVLILDQFEEIFTIGKEQYEKLPEFITELSDMCENRVPLKVQEQLLKNLEKISSDYAKQPYRVVISLREDYLAQLESFKNYLPSIKNSRFRIMQMTVEQAMDAVIKPAKGLVEKNVAVAIIKKLPGISDREFNALSNDKDDRYRFVVEPFLLSLICYQLNEKRIEKELDKITMQLVSQFDIEDVINSFYTNTMKSFSLNVQHGIEDTLLTETGFRKLELVEELRRKYNITNNDINQLTDKRIIRKELRNNVEYVELIHDVLTPVIKQKRDKRLIQLREKEKSDAIRRAIELDRGKRKKVVRAVILIILFAIITFLAFSYQKNRSTVTRYKNLAFAQKLLITSQSLSVNKDYKNAALISRAAFLVNKENNGENSNDFYTSMYKRLTDLGYSFQFSHPDVSQIRAIINSGDIFYIGCANGKIFEQNWMAHSSTLLYDLKEKITSMAISPDKKYLAVAGIFDSIYIVGLTKKLNNIFTLPTQDTLGNGKSICFTDDGKLIVKLDSSIKGWMVNSWSRVLWTKRTEVVWDNKIVNGNDPILWNKNYLSYAQNAFNCIAVLKNKIAVAIDSAVLLISPDSVIKIKSNDLGVISSVVFDVKGNYLYIGNIFGVICRMSLTDYKLELSQYQSARIYDIICNSDGYVASASTDGSVVIIDTKNDWNATNLQLSLTTSSLAGSAYSLSFNMDHQYVLTGYADGSILKWPISSNKLANLICQNVTSTKLDTTIWNKYLSSNIPIEEMKKYNCN